MSTPRFLEYGSSGQVFDGQSVSGDLVLVKTTPEKALITVMDGLGHGAEAADASRQAAEIIAENSSASIDSLVVRCHGVLRKTRGIVVCIAVIDQAEQSLSWLSIGNISGALLRRAGSGERLDEWLLNRPGVVGYRLPPLIESRHPLRDGDVIILATDGIALPPLEAIAMNGGPQATADHIMKSYSKGTDDALVFVGKYHGVGNEFRNRSAGD